PLRCTGQLRGAPRAAAPRAVPRAPCRGQGPGSGGRGGNRPFVVSWPRVRGDTVTPQQLREQLAAIVGPDHVLTAPDELVAYSYDATPLFQAVPDAVVQPGSTAEVAAILRLCHQHRIPVVPRGSGTNLSASTTPIA